MYVIKELRINKGQSWDGLKPNEIARYSRKKLAKGETRAQRNSLGNLLLEKYWQVKYVFNYYEEAEDYYIFIIELDGEIVYEAHVFMEEIEE